MNLVSDLHHKREEASIFSNKKGQLFVTTALGVSIILLAKSIIH